MKKFYRFIFLLLIGLIFLIGCNQSLKTSDVKLGLASVQSGKVTADENEVEFDTIVAGLALVDDKVVYLSIDFSEQFAKIENGEIVTTTLLTKKQRADDYGLKPVSDQSGLGKEWYQQIGDLEKALIGKNYDQVKEYFAGQEILSVATINVDDIEMAVNKAFLNLVEVKAVSKLGLGYHVTLSSRDNTASSLLDYVLLAVDSDDKVVEILIDSAEEKADYQDGWKPVNINKTKAELKADYGMVTASSINSEWYQQNIALMDYLKGMKVSDILALNDFASEIEDLQSSATFGISNVKASIKHAYDNLVDIK